MERKIEIKKGKIITRNELFRRKERFHKKISKISFENKIQILMQLWKIEELIKRKTISRIKTKKI